MDFKEFIYNIEEGAGWCTDGYLINIASCELSSTEIKRAVPELIKKGLFFDGEALFKDRLEYEDNKPDNKYLITQEEFDNRWLEHLNLLPNGTRK